MSFATTQTGPAENRAEDRIQEGIRFNLDGGCVNVRNVPRGGETDAATVCEN